MYLVITELDNKRINQILPAYLVEPLLTKQKAFGNFTFLNTEKMALARRIEFEEIDKYL